MRWLLILVLSAVPVWAEELPAEQASVVACFASLDQGGQWEECMEELFLPCVDHEVATEPHLACLMGERDAWLNTIEHQETSVAGKLTDQGATELGDLMAQWRGYVADKCAGVGAQYSGTGAETAQAGCEISEMVALVDELMSCSKGESIAPYCVKQE